MHIAKAAATAPAKSLQAAFRRIVIPPKPHRERNTMISRTAVVVILTLAGCATNSIPSRPADVVVLKRQVADAERAFARTMASRDHQAFASFLSQEAVFFSGPKPLRGAQQVAEWWKRYYEGPDAPFSWQPEDVEAIWRLEDTGTWRIIFDKGNEVCSAK